jgi:hypothetical protein
MKKYPQGCRGHFELDGRTYLLQIEQCPHFEGLWYYGFTDCPEINGARPESGIPLPWITSFTLGPDGSSGTHLHTFDISEVTIEGPLEITLDFK